VKFTEHGRSPVQVASELSSPELSALTVDVEEPVAGIAAEEAPSCFQEFGKPSRGSVLGRHWVDSLSLRFVLRMTGDIKVKIELGGRGTRFFHFESRWRRRATEDARKPSKAGGDCLRRGPKNESRAYCRDKVENRRDLCSNTRTYWVWRRSTAVMDWTLEALELFQTASSTSC